MQFFNHTGIAAIPELAIVLGIMVLVHEFGHFAVAKLCGVRVEHFAIGFGKRLFGFVHNGTDYRVNLIPLGGYVKLAGVGDEPISSAGEAPAVASNDPGELQNHPRWQRALITLAGPIANFLLAFVLLTVLYMMSHQVPQFLTQAAVVDYVTPNSPAGRAGLQPGDKIVHFDIVENPTWLDLEQRGQVKQGDTIPLSYLRNGHRTDTTLQVTANKENPSDFTIEKSGLVAVLQTEPIQVASLSGQENGPAARAGLQPKDKIVAVDGIRLHSIEALIPYMQDHPGKPLTLTIQRGAATLPLNVTPEQMETGDGKGWRLGFARVLPPVHIERLGLLAAARESYKDNIKNSKLIFEVLHRLFTRQVSVKALQSPIGMGVQVHQAFQESTGSVIEIMAAISLNLGIFNLLPIPILDGGMMVFLFVESILRRDVNQQLKERIYQVAFVCIVLFAAIVIFNDITRIIPHAHT